MALVEAAACEGASAAARGEAVMLAAGDLNLRSDEVRPALDGLAQRDVYPDVAIYFVDEEFLLPHQVGDQKKEWDFIITSTIGRIVVENLPIAADQQHRAVGLEVDWARPRPPSYEAECPSPPCIVEEQ